MTSLHPSRTHSGAAVTSAGNRYRRPASGAEQARRQAWGRKYGAINAAFWKQVHDKERGA